MGSTKEVIDRHLRSFGQRDLNGILSDYAPGAVLFTPEGPLRSVRIGRLPASVAGMTPPVLLSTRKAPRKPCSRRLDSTRR